MSRQTKTYDFSFSEIEDYEEKEEKIIKRKTVEVKPMDEEEAIIQMELLGHQFYMYKDRETSKPAVVYKRKDGGYGIIESEQKKEGIKSFYSFFFFGTIINQGDGKIEYFKKDV